MNGVLASGRMVSLEPVIRVLVVDDSAVAREVLTTILRRDGFDVSTAPTAEVAMTRIAHTRPDVVVLDLQLPGRSGLEFLELQMKRDPIPVVVCSGIAQTGTSAAMRALELGAIDVLPKPALGIRALLGTAEFSLDAIIRAAASARVQRREPPAEPPYFTEEADTAAASRAPATAHRAIVIGASTGGTEAIREIMSRLPPDVPPIVIVQHMPGAFTGAFARRLNSLSAVEVREAEDGDALRPGTALIAPGGRHTELVKSARGVSVRVSDGPLVSRHRPSVDVLFESAARMLGHRAVGILLTGMGADGAQGMASMRRCGAHTIAQDEATCVVYGMPREAVARGGVTQILPLDRIASAVLQTSHT